MEAAAALYSSAEHNRQSLSVSPYNSKQIRSAKNRGHRSVNLTPVPQPSENFGPTSNVRVGLFSSNSYSSHGSLFPNQSSKQPPLLPLPAIPKAHLSSYPPSNSAKPKPQRLARHNSLNPNKPVIRRQGSVAVTRRVSDHGGARVFKPGTGTKGPDPNELPKSISISKLPDPSSLLSLPESSTFSGSVFELAPPASSLPLPKFSLRPKLACKTEAGAESGATDGLRQNLRLP